MREIVTLEEANHLFLILAFAVPAICIATGAFVGRRKGHLARGAGRGLLIGLLGPANLLLWKIYNLIIDRLRLDTVKNLLVNLVFFVTVGVIAGLLINRFYSGRDSGGSASAAESMESRSG